MPEEPQEVAALIDEAAKKSRHPMVSAQQARRTMLHEWFRVVLETSVQLGLAVLPAAPLLGQKLPSIAGEKRISANHPTIVGAEKPNF
jgi:hypothetical protein